MTENLPMDTEKVVKIAIITINPEGVKLARKLKPCFKEARIFNQPMLFQRPLKNFVKTIFNQYDGLIFIAAVGITVRVIGTLAKNKLSDPAVVAIDSAGRFAVSLLSGHEGGANKLAFKAAACLGALPVITTGQEAHKKYILGIGARRGISASRVKLAIKHILKKYKINLKSIRLAASIDLKKNEAGLLKACDDFDLPIVFIPQESIRNFKADISVSEAARRHIGVDGVCEPCALLAGRRTKLIAGKEILNGVTTAIAEEA